jgi:aminomethyltransferase
LSESLLKTPLHAAHVVAGARMVAFAGYEMPVQYKDGVLKEHLWTREHAGAFDVSHMGPAFLSLTAKTGDPAADHAAISAIIEPLVCGDIAGLGPGQLRYTLLLNEAGGLVDDLMVGRPNHDHRQGELYLVVNASTKDGDFAMIEEAAAGRARLTRADDRALIALQGPQAASVVADILPDATKLTFMRYRRFEIGDQQLVISRSGYTGEDGFEMLVPAAIAEAFWSGLLADERVRPIGLGARDSLRLEAGLPLYGHDADESVSPFEAGLGFAVSAKRLKAGRVRGAERLAREKAGGLARVRVGLKVLERAPAREGAPITDGQGRRVGQVTSGGYSPSLGAPIAMGFAPPELSEAGTAVNVIVRDKPQRAEIAAMPFVPHRYVRNNP